MASSRIGFAFTTFVVVVSVLASRAEAQETVTYEQKATTAFALGHFSDAAEDFEKAFELKSDPALLYNAAQAYRLAGNKERALTLYENYLRVYGKREKRAEVETHIEELKQAIAHDKAVATSPPTGTEPVTPGPAVPTPAPIPAPQSPPVAMSAPNALPPAPPPPPPPAATTVLVAATTPTTSQDDSPTKKTWFWVVVGAGVVAAAAAAVILATGGSKDPSPSIGIANGN
jgi:hypothetical protein